MIKPHIRQTIAFSLCIVTLISMCLPHSAWAAVAGRFQFVAGEVNIVSADGTKRMAAKGGAVNEKESIHSGRTGSAQLRMVDDGIVAIRPETVLQIDEYKFANKEGESDRGFFSLLKGGFRSITGLIGRFNKDNYSIRTPSATIGIRGTDHETFHLTTALPDQPVGTYNKVNTGATVVNGTLVGANQVAYAPNLGTSATILPHMPSIFEPPKGGSKQGRDEQKQGKSDKADGQPQAKNEKEPEPAANPENNGEPAQAPADDATQPAPAPADGGTQPAPPPPPPPPTSPLPSNVVGSNLLPPPPTLITATSGSGAVTSGGGTIAAPIGTGGVGGDISIRGPGAQAGGGSIVVEGPDQTILFDATTKLPVLVAEKNIYGSMKYSAGTAQMIDVGKATVGTATVVWGRYVGADQFIDSQGTRDPITMSLMFTDQAMNFIQANTYFQSNSRTFTTIVGGNIVDNLGSIYTATGSLTVTSSASPTLSLVINATNGTRAWGLGYTGNLQQFYQKNCAGGPCGLALTSASLTGAGTVTTITGDAGGVFIGPNAAGALTSFSANASNGTAPVAALQGTALLKP